ncbi:hypothetical protein [Amycolatopsis sulphurea]|uniref:hypothetical protein n=1 Tax=Amycolatopsis sulphurea TaxID=76022 RepID=UPI000BF2E40E|nr:hypothetical protein [Amycolatopsis sulphurea]
MADPRPVRIREFADAVCELLDLPLAEHHRRTRVALPGLSEHQWSLLTRDHWYADDRVWESTGVPPGPGLAVRLAEAADWYRELLLGQDRIRTP